MCQYLLSTLNNKSKEFEDPIEAMVVHNLAQTGCRTCFRHCANICPPSMKLLYQVTDNPRTIHWSSECIIKIIDTHVERHAY